MESISTIKAQIKAANSGQIAVGTNISQIQNIYLVHTDRGGVAYVVTPETMPTPKVRASVWRPPRPFPDLLGREAEVQEASAALESGETVICYGEAGIGKTVLLRHVAHQLDTASFADGVVYRSIQGQSEGDVLQGLFEEFYSTPIPLKPTEAQLRGYLQEKRALLLLDDVDLTREALETVMEAAQAATFHLVSQERCLFGEGHPMALQGLPLDAAMVLIERELGRELVPAEKAAARRLCEALQRHPLHVIQATARVREEGASLQELARQIAGGMEGGLIDAESFSTSERRVLAVLALLGGKPLLARHAEALALVVDDGAPEAEEILERLERRGLVQADGPRYRLHAPLVATLQGAWDLTPALDRALAFFVPWARSQRATPERITAEGPALTQVLHRTVEAGRWDDTLRLGRAMEGALALGGRWDAWDDVLQACMQAAEARRDRAARAWVLHQRGTRALCLAQPAAGTWLREALRLREALGDEIGAEITRHNLDVLRLVPLPTKEETPSGPKEPPSGLWTKIKQAPLLLKGVLIGFPLLLLLVVALWTLIPQSQTPPPRIQAPAGLSASVLGPTEVELAWKDTNDGKTPFGIERKTDEAAFTVGDRVDARTTTFRDRGVTPNTSYTYRIAALGDGEPVYGAEVRVRTLPAIPTGLAVESDSETALRLSWGYAGGAIPAFQIERCQGESEDCRREEQFQEIATVTEGTTTFPDQDLVPNTAYAYQVRAFNDTGVSKPSEVVRVLTRSFAPPNLEVTPVSQEENRLGWEDPNPNSTGYRIERHSGDGVFEVIGTAAAGRLEYLDRGVAPNTDYFYRMRATGGGGDAPYSEEQTVLTYPDAPTELTADAATPTTITLRWRDRNRRPVEVFAMERMDPGGGVWEVEVEGAAVYTDRSLSPNTTYVYRVRARNATGFSGYSNIEPATTTSQTRLDGVTLNPRRVRAGEAVKGTVLLSGSAPAGGIRVRLSSSQPRLAPVQENVPIPAGQMHAEFRVQTDASMAEAIEVRITATYDFAEEQASFVVMAPPPPPDLAADRIEFRILEKADLYTGIVEIRGVVRNVGESEAGTDVWSAVLYEGGRRVAAVPIDVRLQPGEEVAVVYPREWSIASPNEGERPPTYRLVIEGAIRDANPLNDEMERGGVHFIRNWRREDILNKVF